MNILNNLKKGEVIEWAFSTNTLLNEEVFEIITKDHKDYKETLKKYYGRLQSYEEQTEKNNFLLFIRKR